MRNRKKEFKKPKSAEDKGKRYRCCICRKKSPRKTKMVPFYCAEHLSMKDAPRDDFGNVIEQFQITND